MLLDRIAAEIVSAQKQGQQERLGVLRLLLSQIRNREIELRAAGRELNDDEVTAALAKEAKKRKEAIELYNKGGRADLADKEKAELELIYEYIPREMSREEVEKEVDAALEELSAAGGSAAAREFPAVMKAAMARMKGRADGKMVSEVIKGKLG